MSKIYFFILLLPCICIQTHAQTNFGIVGGASIAKTSASGSNNHAGAYFGGVMDLKFGKSGSFRPQLLYVMKGENGGNGKGVYNYLELPVNILYNIPSKIGRFSLGGGPALSYMVSGAWTAQGGAKEKIYFAYDRVNQLDYGLNLQGGLEVKGGLFFILNYTLGLSNVWQSTDIGTNKNSAMGIGIGFMF